MAYQWVQEIPLPAPVEELIQVICWEKSTSPADIGARRKLAGLGERDSLRILGDIRNWATVPNFSGSIARMAAEISRSPRTPPPPPSNSNSRSSLSPPSPVLGSPRSVTSSPQGNASTPNKRRRTLDFSDGAMTSIVEHSTGLPTGSEAKGNMLMANGFEDVLEEFEFRKAFLILNYTGRHKLENVVTIDKLQSLNKDKKMKMDRFEIELWNEFGRNICKGNERRKYLDWDSGMNYSYHCHVYADGSCSFKGPFLNKTTTLLQKVVGDENVLIVKFVEEKKDGLELGSGPVMSYPAFNKVFEEGIFVCRRRYQFFVFKDGGKEEKKKSPTSSPVKCYFVNIEAFASFFAKGPQLFRKKSIQDARSLFMHIHQAPSLSNYMARFSLILSKTISLNANMDEVKVEVIRDELCQDAKGDPILNEDGKPRIYTDGTGFISEDLALKCPQNCFKGSVSDDRNIQRFTDAIPHAQDLLELNHPKSQAGEPPLLIQFRMFHQGRAIKGTVLVNRKLPPKTIQVRDSMLKVDTDRQLKDAPSVKKFEIVGTSYKPKNPRLSKNLIALLHYGGVPRKFFLDIVDEAFNDTPSFLTKRRAALKVAINRDADDDKTVVRMILSGIPLDEPFLQHRLSGFVKDEWKNLKAGKLPISDSFYVMGTADPTRSLNSGEVCVILEHGQLSGDVLVYRNPGVHPGDVHVVKAKYVKALEEIVGNSKYGIFFPSTGRRSMADEIAGGDYDGDMYWVSRNSELLEYFEKSDPWECTSSSPKVDSKKPNIDSDEVLERDLFRLYLSTRFQPSKAMSVAADSWLVFMDRFLTLGDDCVEEKERLRQKIFKLVDIYYDALDAPKKGKKVQIPRDLIPDKYPHHMERGEFRTYKSSSILGQIHDKVDGFKNPAPVKFWMLPCFKKQLEQIPTASLQTWRLYYQDYRTEMAAAVEDKDESTNESARAVYQIYKKILYGIGPDDDADELDKSRKAWEDIRVEAVAAYNATYEYAVQVKDPQKFNFAWKVAGSALLKIFMDDQGEKPICCAPSVLVEMFR